MKKRHHTLVHIFTKYYSILKILLLAYSLGNLQQSTVKDLITPQTRHYTALCN